MFLYGTDSKQTTALVNCCCSKCKLDPTESCWPTVEWADILFYPKYSDVARILYIILYSPLPT